MIDLHRYFPMAVLLCCSLSASAMAALDFSATTISVSQQSPKENEVVEFSIVLLNTGDTDAGCVDFTVEWPFVGFLVGTSGYDGEQIGYTARQITSTLPLAAQAERHFSVKVLATRDSGGYRLSLSIRAADFNHGVAQ